jgi:hypothetical protein
MSISGGLLMLTGSAKTADGVELDIGSHLHIGPQRRWKSEHIELQRSQPLKVVN